MITSSQIKDFLRDNCGAEASGIAPATSYSAEVRERYTKNMEMMAAVNPAVQDPTLFDPEDFVEGAKAVIVFGGNSCFGTSPYSGNAQDGEPRGAIGNFYLNDKILNRSLQNVSRLTGFLEEKGFKADAPFVGFSQKVKALEAGIGFQGKNTLVINKKFGSWISLITVITDAPLEPDQPIQFDCGTCNRCVEACPTGALSSPNAYQVDKCIIYYLCHLKKEIPEDIRAKIGVRAANCTVCSDVCPHNKELLINEDDKLPDDMIYPKLIPLMNITEDEYEKRYGSQMFGFIMGGRTYLRRNIAVALGNSGSKKAVPCLEIAARDEEPLVSSHAEWALKKIKDSG